MRSRLAAALAACALAAPAAVAGTALDSAVIVLAGLGLVAIVASVVAARVTLLAVAIALLGAAYASGLGSGVDAWAPLHAGALVAAAEVAERAMRPAGLDPRRIALTAAGATLVAALALAVATVDARPGGALRLTAIAAAGAALVVAAARSRGASR